MPQGFVQFDILIDAGNSARLDATGPSKVITAVSLDSAFNRVFLDNIPCRPEVIAKVSGAALFQKLRWLDRCCRIAIGITKPEHVSALRENVFLIAVQTQARPVLRGHKRVFSGL